MIAFNARLTTLDLVGGGGLTDFWVGNVTIKALFSEDQSGSSVWCELK